MTLSPGRSGRTLPRSELPRAATVPWSSCFSLPQSFGCFQSITRPWRIMLEKVADSAFFAPKLAEPYKPYGGQFLDFCSIYLSTYQTCMKLTRKSTEFCPFFCRHYPPRPIPVLLCCQSTTVSCVTKDSCGVAVSTATL